MEGTEILKFLVTLNHDMFKYQCLSRTIKVNLTSVTPEFRVTSLSIPVPVTGVAASITSYICNLTKDSIFQDDGIFI